MDGRSSLLLLEQRGTVVSRDRILREVWKDEQGSSSNVIEVYVRLSAPETGKAGTSRDSPIIRRIAENASDNGVPVDPR